MNTQSIIESLTQKMYADLDQALPQYIRLIGTDTNTLFRGPNAVRKMSAAAAELEGAWHVQDGKGFQIISSNYVDRHWNEASDTAQGEIAEETFTVQAPDGFFIQTPSRESADAFAAKHEAEVASSTPTVKRRPTYRNRNDVRINRNGYLDALQDIAHALFVGGEDAAIAWIRDNGAGEVTLGVGFPE